MGPSHRASVGLPEPDAPAELTQLAPISGASAACRYAGADTWSRMPWSAVRVRPATSEDVPVLLGFGEELRDRLLPSVDAKRARGTHARGLDARYLDAMADPERHLVVAVGDDDVPLGMAMFTV